MSKAVGSTSYVNSWATLVMNSLQESTLQYLAPGMDETACTVLTDKSTPIPTTDR